jgi:hypothetical protein
MTTPEVLSAVSLNGTALRRAAERARIDEAVQELRELAGGRNDLLAQEAGLIAGAWFASPATHVGHELIAAGLLVLAGHRLDYDLLARWVEVGVDRGRSARRPVHGALGR